MNKINVVILNEDLKIGNQLAEQLAPYPQLYVAAVRTDISQIDAYIHQYSPHLLLLETSYGVVSGLVVVKYINQRYPWLKVAFVTKYTEHALAAFELKVMDYLVYPVKQERLTKMVKKIEGFYIERHTAPPLYLHAFGQTIVKNSELLPIKLRTKKSAELLCFLWQRDGESAARDIIIEALWPTVPVEKAVVLLHSTLYQLRQTLKREGYKQPISLRNKRYSLNVQVVTDVERALALVAAATFDEPSIVAVLTYYEGDYFEKADYAWAEPKRIEIRKRMRHYFLQVLEQDVVSFVKNQVAERLLTWQCYDEQCVLTLMRYYSSVQQREKIEEVYQRASEYVRGTLGVDMCGSIEEMYCYYLLMTPKKATAHQ